MDYDFAMQDSSGDLEVRYTIRPIDPVEQKKTHMDFDNELTNFTMFSAILYNISDQRLQTPELVKKIKNLSPNAVNRDFNGDDARVSKVNLGKEFGQADKIDVTLYLIEQTDNGVSIQRAGL